MAATFRAAHTPGATCDAFGDGRAPCRKRANGSQPDDVVEDDERYRAHRLIRRSRPLAEPAGRAEKLAGPVDAEKRPCPFQPSCRVRVHRPVREARPRCRDTARIDGYRGWSSSSSVKNDCGHKVVATSRSDVIRPGRSREDEGDRGVHDTPLCLRQLHVLSLSSVRSIVVAPRCTSPSTNSSSSRWAAVGGIQMTTAGAVGKYLERRACAGARHSTTAGRQAAGAIVDVNDQLAHRDPVANVTSPASDRRAACVDHEPLPPAECGRCDIANGRPDTVRTGVDENLLCESKPLVLSR